MIKWYLILIIALLFLAFICWKEWNRRNRKKLALRLCTSVMAITSILLLAYPFKKTTTTQSAGKIILLTNGFSNDSLDNFLHNSKASLFSTDLAIAKSFPDKKIQFVDNLPGFFNNHNNDTIHLFGNGFEKKELDLLNKSSFIFHDHGSFPAITSVNWKQQLKPGEPLIVQGKYDNNVNQEIKISLQGFGETFDSLTIKGQLQKDFSLTTIPKHTGKAVYSLLVLSGKDTLQNEPVPLNIQSISPLKILLLSSSPDFEKTFLKNKLSQNAYEITASTVISKGRKSEQFINMHSSSSDLVSNANLEKFDVIITDDEAISQLNVSQSANLRSAIEEKGIGLVVKISNSKNSSSFYSRFFPSLTLQQDKKPFIVIRSSTKDSNSYKLKIDEPIVLRNENGAQALLKDDQSNIFASNIIYGQGRIVATTLNNTYTMALAGDNKSWQSLWSLLIDKAAKKIFPAENWDITPALPFVNEPSLLIQKNNPGISQAIIGNSKVYLEKDSLLPYQLKGIYLPAESGWQSLVQQNGKIKNWYAFAAEDWKILRDYHRLKSTKEYILKHPVEFIQQGAGQTNNWTSHLKLYLVILFFICCSILWVEQKLG